MKNYIGKKCKGFKSDYYYNSRMDNYNGKVGVITSKSNDGLIIDFGDTKFIYPISEIEKHLVKDKIKISQKVYEELCKDENVKAILEKKSFKKSVKEILKSGYEPVEKLDLIKELLIKK